MLKNTASQIIGAQMVNIADGLAFTGTARVAITIDGGVQDTTPAGTVTHEGRGYHSYNPSQAETNGDILAFTFDDSGGLAVPVTVQVYTIDAIATDVWSEATRELTGAANITDDGGVINVASGVVEANLLQMGGVVQSATDLKDFADSGYDPATNKVEGVKLVDTTTTNTDMRGTDSAALASVATEARLSELDAGTAGKAANQIDIIQTDTTTDIPAQISGLNDISVADILTTQMTESYAANGVAPTHRS